MGTSATTCVHACVRPAHEDSPDEDRVTVLQLAVTAPCSVGESRSSTSRLDETRGHRGETGTAAAGPAPSWFQASPRDSCCSDGSIPLQWSSRGNASTTMSFAGSSEELFYEGTHLGTQKHGTGFLKMKGCTYQGDFQEDAKHGCGTLSWDDGRRYVGQFCDGKFDGFAVMSWPDGRLYRGQYAAGYKHGEGTFSWHDGRCYRGQWSDGKRHGEGLYTNAKGLTRKGTWKADRPAEWEPIMLHEPEECQGGHASLFRSGRAEDMLALAAPVKARRHDDHDLEKGSHDDI